jgi:hypothetical protein
MTAVCEVADHVEGSDLAPALGRKREAVTKVKDIHVM